MVRGRKKKRRRRNPPWVPRPEEEELVAELPAYYGPQDRPPDVRGLPAGSRHYGARAKKRNAFVNLVVREVLTQNLIHQLSPIHKRLIAKAEGLTGREISRRISSGGRVGRPTKGPSALEWKIYRLASGGSIAATARHFGVSASKGRLLERAVKQKK